MTTPYHLVVVSPFGQYQRGDIITDETMVQAILDVNNAEMHPFEAHVRRVLVTSKEITI